MKEDRKSLPPFTDLGALADHLAKLGKGQLRAMVTQAWKAQSCLGDLAQARDCMDALGEMIERPKSGDSSAVMATERALMTTAILLYARATSTNGQGGERGSIQLSRDKLALEEWTDHMALLDVRNQAMAHVYSSRTIAGEQWHRDIFFAVYEGAGQWKPASASNQSSFHAETFERLKRALPVARRLLREKFFKRMRALTAYINQDVKGEQLEKFVFDPVHVFGSEEGVRLILAGKGQGEASFWVNEGDRRPS